jgi:RimJ/RimL family protein N-acetyltransferase
MISASSRLVEADLGGRAVLAHELGIEVPDNWPPDLYDRQAMQYTLGQLAEPSAQGWYFWYLQLKEPAVRRLVGICGFKGRPDARGSVEIGYSILSQFRGQGLASEAVQGLVSWAFSHPSVCEVTAETLPYLTQSIGVLRKCGFHPAGRGSEHGVVRYVIDRSALR